MTTFSPEQAQYQVLVRMPDLTLDIGYVAAVPLQCEYCNRSIDIGEIFTTQPYGPLRAQKDSAGGLGVTCRAPCRPCTVVKDYRHDYR